MRTMKTTLSFALAGLLLLAACDSIDTGELDDPVVVEAFLFAGEPIDDTLVGLIGIPIEATGIAERWGDLEVIRLTKPIRKVNP